MSRRLLAIVALVVGAATIVLAVWVAVSEFPRGLLLLGCMLVAVAAAWYGLLRRGPVRVVGSLVAALALVGATVVLLTRGAPLVDVLIVLGVMISLGAASAAFTRHVDLPSVPAPRHPVLFFNPRSGGGKAERFALAVEARKRGIKAVKLDTGKTSRRWSGRRSPTVRTGSRWPAETGRRPSSPRSPASSTCRMPASLRALVTISRSIWVWTATMLSVHLTRSSTAVNGGSISVM